MSIIRVAIYELLKCEVDIDTDKINLNDHHKKATIDSIITTEAHRKKFQLRNSQHSIVYSRAFKPDDDKITFTLDAKDLTIL